MSDQARELFRQWADLREHRRHKLGRALEHANYTLISLDYGSEIYTDIESDRTAATDYPTAIQSQESLIDAGFESPVRGAEAAGAFEVLEEEFPQEAQYVVPMAYLAGR